MAAIIHSPGRSPRPARRWTRSFAWWVVVLGAMSAVPCRRGEAPVTHSEPAARPAAPLPVGGAGPAARRPTMRHVLGVQPRAARRAVRATARHRSADAADQRA